MAKIMTGTVVSTKMQKTINVLVERKLTHPMLKKVIIRHKKFKAHCENPDIKEGDVVTIQETKPFSKEVRFVVVEKGAEVSAPVEATAEKKTTRRRAVKNTEEK